MFTNATIAVFLAMYILYLKIISPTLAKEYAFEKFKDSHPRETEPKQEVARQPGVY
jgi:hypothetical protein